ncbi:MAG: 2-oxoacid:acceptor oxidoreductase family protein [Acidobacteriia bacterium]|nr:2-oxoacid:acceptor oxidoreductase family protein [Terriglobia bacterium]
MYTIVQQRADSIYDLFERKDGDPHVTHYCPGCGHGVIHKMIAECLDDLGVQDRTILVSPVGCSVFAYYYFDVGNVQAPHGRAPAVATGIKRSRPGSIVLSYQGDGDLAAIGGNEILHAANRGEGITVFFVNNAIYGMTGGQMAPTSLLGQKTTTSPFGRTVQNEGYPMRVCELLASLEAPVYLERTAIFDSKNNMRTRKAIRKAIQNQIDGLGFSLVEILSPCPTIWKMTPQESRKWLNENMIPYFKLGVYRDKTAPPAKTAETLQAASGSLSAASEAGQTPAPKVPAGNAVEPSSPPPVSFPRAPRKEVPLVEVPSILGIRATERPGETSGSAALLGNYNERSRFYESTGSPATPRTEAGSFPPAVPEKYQNPQIKIAGFGGQGVLLLGEVLAESGMLSGYRVSWLPSYGPEMRGGTAHCHVRLSQHEIGSPLVSRPTILLSLNKPSLLKFLPEATPGALVIYNSSLIDEPPVRDDIETVPLSATEIAEKIGSPKVTNMVMIGGLMARTHLLSKETVFAAIDALVKNQKLIEMNRRAIEAGMQAVQEMEAILQV